MLNFGTIINLNLTLMDKKYFLAVDLGATSGRVMVSAVSEGNITLQEIYRFKNGIVEKDGTYFWDIEKIFSHIKEGLKVASQQNLKYESIGVDTWGVDMVCFDKEGNVIAPPRAYRDPYTEGIPEEFFKKMSRDELYARTGIQIMNFNSVFQLYALNKEGSAALKAADKILFMPDAFSYMMTGTPVTEYTILSTSAFMNPATKKIDEDILKITGVGVDKFAPIVAPGTRVGLLKKELAEEVGLPQISVVAVAGHDTASAIAAVPAQSEHFAYLSSGTWSLMGIESPKPIVSERSSSLNYTNEGGVENTTTFLKNITGMWILEQCLKVWEAAGRKYSYSDVTAMAADLPTRTIIDPDDPMFANPENMVVAIESYCAEHKLIVPQSDAEFARCIFDSLANKYKEVLADLEEFAGHSLDCLHIIGGGSNNALLNQMTADALGIKVVAGPSESTALGSVMMQARALGLVDSISQMRDYIFKSVKTRSFVPGNR